MMARSALQTETLHCAVLHRDGTRDVAMDVAARTQTAHVKLDQTAFVTQCTYAEDHAEQAYDAETLRPRA